MFSCGSPRLFIESNGVNFHEVRLLSAVTVYVCMYVVFGVLLSGGDLCWSDTTRR